MGFHTGEIIACLRRIYARDLRIEDRYVGVSPEEVVIIENVQGKIFSIQDEGLYEGWYKVEWATGQTLWIQEKFLRPLHESEHSWFPPEEKKERKLNELPPMPWMIEPGREFVSAEGKRFAFLHRSEDPEESYSPYIVDNAAKRIVACVNACKDLDHPEKDLKDLITRSNLYRLM
jgi:hypothetical protein